MSIVHLKGDTYNLMKDQVFHFEQNEKKKYPRMIIIIIIIEINLTYILQTYFFSGWRRLLTFVRWSTTCSDDNM